MLLRAKLGSPTADLLATGHNEWIHFSPGIPCASASEWQNSPHTKPSGVGRASFKGAAERVCSLLHPHEPESGPRRGRLHAHPACGSGGNLDRDLLVTLDDNDDLRPRIYEREHQNLAHVTLAVLAQLERHIHVVGGGTRMGVQIGDGPSDA